MNRPIFFKSKKKSFSPMFYFSHRSYVSWHTRKWNIKFILDTLKLWNSFSLSLAEIDTAVPKEKIFSSPVPKGQVSLCHHLASVVVRRLSSSVVVNYFKNLLLWNYLAKYFQTLTECSLGYLIYKLYPKFWSINKHGRHC